MDEQRSAPTPDGRLASVEDRIDRLSQQVVLGQKDTTLRLDFLRSRAGWILLWAAIAGLGSCSYSNNRTSDDISQLRTSVDRLTTGTNGSSVQVANQDDVLQLCYQIGALRAAQGKGAPTADDAGTTTTCFERATAGFKSGTPAKR